VKKARKKGALKYIISGLLKKDISNNIKKIGKYINLLILRFSEIKKPNIQHSSKNGILVNEKERIAIRAYGNAKIKYLFLDGFLEKNKA